MKPLSPRTLLTLDRASAGHLTLNKKKKTVRKFLVKALCKILMYSAITVVTVYLINIVLCQRISYLTINDLVFMEALIFILAGALLFLGSGGLSPTTFRASLLAAAADAIYDEDYSISEMVERDSWKPKGYPRLALVLLISGTALLALYFVSIV